MDTTAPSGRRPGAGADTPDPAARTALVTGGTGALGGAVVDLLVERGYRVAVPHRPGGGAAARLAERHAAAVADDRLRTAPADVADPAELGGFLDALTADWGPLWLACGAAGAFASDGGVRDADVDLWDAQLRVNLRTAVVTAREGLRRMGPEGGRVVLVASRSALHPRRGQAAYAASKAAVLTLVATLAEELRGTPVTANAVVPHVIDTPANRAAMPDADRSGWVPPAAIAEVIAWLAGPTAWPVTGAAIPVDA